MEVIIFEKESYHQMMRELMAHFKNAIKEAKKEAFIETSPANDWITSEEAKGILGFKSKSKLQKMRDQGDIVFTQHGRTIKYSKSSILNFLNKHKVC